LLGSALRKRRKALNLSQEELAGRLCLERGYISMIETGRKTPSLETLQALCSALEIKVYELLKEVDL
jgi:transcriptional regulator with XRE-family HTH domain